MILAAENGINGSIAIEIGHAYLLEGSQDGNKWKRIGGHDDIQMRSPHTDAINKAYRYLRVKISKGVQGLWEWRLLGNLPSMAYHYGQPIVQWGDWQQWGETEKDKSFRNPVIPADYSDLDCIRVGDDYWMTPPWNFDAALIAVLARHDHPSFARPCELGDCRQCRD